MAAGKMFGLAASLMLAVVVLLADEARADECVDLKWDCQFNVSGSSSSVVSLMSGDSLNVTAIIAACQTIQGRISTCDQELRRICPASFDFNGTMTTMMASFNSVCGAESLCSYRLQDCGPKGTIMSVIGNAMRQRPPDVARVETECRKLNATVKPCVAKLRADCSDVVSDLSTSLGYISDGLNSLCGKAVLCQLQIGKCGMMMANISQVGRSGNTREMCRLIREGQSCVNSSLDPECLSVPGVQTVVDAFNSQGAAMPCSGEKKMECPELVQCFMRKENAQDNDNAQENDDSCDLGGILPCVAGLKGTCNVKEDRITFSEVQKLSEDFCHELKKSAALNNTCSELQQCVMGSGVLSKYLSSPNNLDIAPLLDSITWARYLEVVSGCVMRSAGTCGLDPSLTAFMTRQDAYLKGVIASSAIGSRQTVRDSTLVLLVAVFAAWARTFL